VSEGKKSIESIPFVFSLKTLPRGYEGINSTNPIANEKL